VFQAGTDQVGGRLDRAAQREDGLHEVFGDVSRQFRILVIECRLAELDGLFIAGEFPRHEPPLQGATRG
jgi:hypothetical protein